MTSKTLTLLWLLLCWSVQKSALAYELVAVQAVSKSRKTFVTRTGKEQGVALGQEATFTTVNLSVSAEAMEVTREYTLWKVKDKKTRLPFERGELVVMNNNLESLWYQIPLARIKPPEFSGHLILKLGYHRAVSESIDQVSSTEGQVRQGGQMSAIYHWPTNGQLYIGTGIRYDNESAKNEFITVPTERLFSFASVEYHISRLDYRDSILYLGANLGLGYSTSKVDGVEQSGLALLLPSLRLGLNVPVTEDWSLLLETEFDNISMREKTPDGTIQSTTIINGKLGLGTRIVF